MPVQLKQSADSIFLVVGYSARFGLPAGRLALYGNHSLSLARDSDERKAGSAGRVHDVVPVPTTSTNDNLNLRVLPRRTVFRRSRSNSSSFFRGGGFLSRIVSNESLLHMLDVWKIVALEDIKHPLLLS